MKLLLAALLILSLSLPCHAFQAARFEAINGLPPVNGGIVALGDSITAFMPMDTLYEEKIYNRGVSGMTTGQLLRHLPDLVTGYPDEIRILIGVNDFLLAGIGPYVSFRNYQAILEWLVVNRPAAKIIVYSVLPTRSPYINQNVRTLNGLLASYVERQGEDAPITWVNLYPCMVDAQGLAKREYVSDAVHPTVAGYQEMVKESMSKKPGGQK